MILFQFIPASNIKIFKDLSDTPLSDADSEKIKPGSSTPLDTNALANIKIRINPNSPSKLILLLGISD